ncbi:MAG TPA: hypothetical protein PK293_17745 [Spirochaetota bacterium]|nr:hypothetical protein [Spirochaetota bacterium]
MKLKTIFIYIAVSLVFLSTNSCLSTVKFEEFQALPDRTFYLDFFETDTLELITGFDLSEEDTKNLQDHYARKLPMEEIKTLLEKKYRIRIESAEFNDAVKMGPITDSENSTTEKSYGQWFARWKAPSAVNHKNQMRFGFSFMENKGCVIFNYYIYFIVDGKLVDIPHTRGSEPWINGRYEKCNLRVEGWKQFYYDCVQEVLLSLKIKTGDYKLRS